LALLFLFAEKYVHRTKHIREGKLPLWVQGFPQWQWGKMMFLKEIGAGGWEGQNEA